MNIGLDFDNTYTRDPEAWNDFIDRFQQSGHNVYVVTMRHKQEGREVEEALAKRVDGIFFTGRKGKQKFMFDRGISIDVWIDDMPIWVTQDAAPDPVWDKK